MHQDHKLWYYFVTSNVPVKQKLIIHERRWGRQSSEIFFFWMFHPNSSHSLHYLQHVLLKGRASINIIGLTLKILQTKSLVQFTNTPDLSNTVKIVLEIILIEEGSLKRLWEEQTYFTAINQKLLQRAINKRRQLRAQ